MAADDQDETKRPRRRLCWLTENEPVLHNCEARSAAPCPSAIWNGRIAPHEQIRAVLDRAESMMMRIRRRSVTDSVHSIKLKSRGRKLTGDERQTLPHRDIAKDDREDQVSDESPERLATSRAGGHGPKGQPSPALKCGPSKNRRGMAVGHHSNPCQLLFVGKSSAKDRQTPPGARKGYVCDRPWRRGLCLIENCEPRSLGSSLRRRRLIVHSVRWRRYSELERVKIRSN